MLASHLACPRKGRLEAVSRIFAYHRMVFDPTYPEIDTAATTVTWALPRYFPTRKPTTLELATCRRFDQFNNFRGAGRRTIKPVILVKRRTITFEEQADTQVD